MLWVNKNLILLLLAKNEKMSKNTYVNIYYRISNCQHFVTEVSSLLCEVISTFV